MRIIDHTPSFSTNAPVSFPLAQLPAQVSVLGGSNENFGTIVLLREEEQEAALALREEVDRAGWRLMHEQDGSRRGFLAQPPIVAAYFCHSTLEGQLIVEQIAVEQERYFWITHNTASSTTPSRSPFDECAVRSRSALVSDRTPDGRQTMSAALPLLKLPGFGEPGGSLVGVSSSSNGTDSSAHATMELTLAVSIKELNEHLVEQLREQGWTAQSAEAGADTIASDWIKADEKGLPLYGTLRISRGKAGQYQLTFYMSRSLSSEQRLIHSTAAYDPASFPR